MILLFSAVGSLLVGGCGGSGGSEPLPKATAAPTSTPTPIPTSKPTPPPTTVTSGGSEAIAVASFGGSTYAFVAAGTGIAEVKIATGSTLASTQRSSFAAIRRMPISA
ncbi:MAG: hypothetical protein ACLPYS_08620, partial [Vulcanimicrobiaceae bacterium]